MKVAKLLDYNLQAYQERLGLVNFLYENGDLDGMPPSELDKVANYLLYSEDVDAEVELKQGSKKKISYEELIESTIGEGTVQSSDRISIYKVPKPRIDREKDADIPFMKDLWEAIDTITEQYQYCKDVLEGKRDMIPDRKLIPTYQTKYFLREGMVDLRREQFLLKDSFRPVVGNAITFQGGSEPKDDFGMCIGEHILCPGEMMVDYGNGQHIYAMLKHYSGMKSKLIDNPYHAWGCMYDFLEELIDRTRFSPEHYHILIRKIDKVSNEQIAKELFDINGKTYSVNYISTIFKQNISKQLVKTAYLWGNEKEYKPDGTFRTMFKWRICPICGRQLFADDINFGKTMDGNWKDMCKDCSYKEKLEREKRRKEKRARRNAKKDSE